MSVQYQTPSSEFDLPLPNSDHPRLKKPLPNLSEVRSGQLRCFG